MIRCQQVLALVGCGLLSISCATNQGSVLLPAFQYQGVVLQAADLKYQPHDDVIFPSVIRTHRRISRPLGKFYMYYAPHDVPGGICLAYADRLEGPWREYENNPIINREWPSHYKVSHVSGPDAIWSDEGKKLLLYYHGENAVTRLATSEDGIHFAYEGEVVTTAMFPQLSEASYGRVFRHRLPGTDNRYIMLLMGNDGGTRRIYLAWSKDGFKWEVRGQPVLNPPPGTDQVAGAVLFPWRRKIFVIAHANNSRSDFNTGFDLYAATVDPGFKHATWLGKFYDRRQVSPKNEAVMSPCFIADAGRWYMFFNLGPRLQNKIGLAASTRSRLAFDESTACRSSR